MHRKAGMTIDNVFSHNAVSAAALPFLRFLIAVSMFSIVTSVSVSVVTYIIQPHLVELINLLCIFCRINKSAQSNLGRGPRRGGVAHGAGLWPACVAEMRWASVAWRSFMNMAKLNWLS